MSATFQAVWPILTGQGHANLTDTELIDDALADLPTVAARHNVTLTGKPQVAITDGARFPGANGARKVVVIETPARALPRMADILGAAA